MSSLLLLSVSGSVTPAFEQELGASGWQLRSASAPTLRAIELSAGEPALCLVLSLAEPISDAGELIDRIRHDAAWTCTVIVAAYPQSGTSFERLRELGANDVIELVSSDITGVPEALLAWTAAVAPALLGPLKRSRFEGFVGASEEMQRVYDLMDRAARVSDPVLLIGETGSGKEIAARAVHGLGRSEHPFEALNCHSPTGTLLESDLFGHLRGAFTGATENRSGLLVTAGPGTVFLDEIGDAPPGFQAKLLRVLEERSFRPLGSDASVRLEARIVAALNQDPADLVANGKLREDLYYRLSIITIRVPPLRERATDIPLLAQHFLAEVNQENGRELVFPAGVLSKLQSLPWPGNVRQLRNAVRRAAQLSDPRSAVIEKSLLFTDPLLRGAGKSTGNKESGRVEDWERASAKFRREYAQQVLEAGGGSVVKAAKLAGVHRSTLSEWLKEQEEEI
jgi:DNA-binding NtrC family response regulator